MFRFLSLFDSGVVGPVLLVSCEKSKSIQSPKEATIDKKKKKEIIIPRMINFLHGSMSGCFRVLIQEADFCQLFCASFESRDVDVALVISARRTGEGLSARHLSY